MGEIADAIINGDFCDNCGCWMGEGDGYPRTCSACGGTELKKSTRRKVACRDCGKMVKKGQGIMDHLRVVHGK